MLCRPKKWVSTLFSHSLGPKMATLEDFLGWGVLFYGPPKSGFGSKSVGGGIPPAYMGAGQIQGPPMGGRFFCPTQEVYTRLQLEKWCFLTPGTPADTKKSNFSSSPSAYGVQILKRPKNPVFFRRFWPFFRLSLSGKSAKTQCKKGPKTLKNTWVFGRFKIQTP